jgi:4'-phosphopantetheinyl transferase
VASDEVHSWCASLDVPPETSARFYATLSFDERNRSARFRFEHDRQRFIVAHGVLRDLLGRYLQIQPGRISYVYNAFGKPDLGPEFGSQLKFNLSHSAGLALIAIAADSNVGVDLEPVHPFAGMNEVAAEYFPPQARAAYEAAPPAQRAAVFFRWWTRIEAAGKAVGCGLDQAAFCLDRVSHQSCDAFPELAIAVAAQTSGPLIVSWRKLLKTSD